ncbi:MAG: hypothetical protein ACXQS2_05120 [Methermicoccaceae archaeon]
MKVEEIYENGIRYYLTDAGKLPSVTSIIHKTLPEPDELKIWKMLNPDWKDLLKRYKYEGEFIHYRVLNRYAIRTLEPPEIDPSLLFDSEFITAIETGELMWDELGLNISPIMVEEVLINRKHRYAGRVDMIAEIDGQTVVIDLKRHFEPSRKQFLLQIGAYAHAYGLDKVDKGMVVSLCPDQDQNPTLEAKVVEINKEELSCFASEFLTLMEVFYEKEEGSRKTPEL